MNFRGLGNQKNAQRKLLKTGIKNNKGFHRNFKKRNKLKKQFIKKHKRQHWL